VYFLFHSTLAGPVRLHGLGATFAGEDVGGKPELKVDDVVATDGIELHPQTTTVVKATVLPCATISEAVTCMSVSASIGDGTKAVQLQWTTGKHMSTLVPGFLYSDHTFCIESARKVPWASIPTVRHATVTKLASRVVIALQHRRPALVGECYTLTICLTSEEPVEMTDVRLHLSILENGEPCHVLMGADNGEATADPVAEEQWEIEPIAVGDSIGRTVKLSFDKVSFLALHAWRDTLPLCNVRCCDLRVIGVSIPGLGLWC
jgi:hypothetical protein